MSIMNTRRLYAYVDESGDTRLGSTGESTSHLFHVVAVVVDDDQKSAAEEQLDAISKKHMGGGKLKSSSVGRDNARRLRVLESIADIDFGYYALSVNKDEIIRVSGYRWKPSFFKATRRRIYEKITYSAYGGLQIYSHRYGNQEYMDSFPAYLEKMPSSDLFFQPNHEFIDDSSRLIQLADFLAGTLGYCFDPDKTSEYSPQFRTLLASRELGIEVWPITLDRTIVPESPDGSEATMQRNLLVRVRNYLEQLAKATGDEERMQEHVLSKLLYARLYSDSRGQAICSDRLVEALGVAGFERPTKQSFGSLIGKIRDRGIIIAGTSQGYRLALTMHDIAAYLEHNRSVVYPMLSRIVKARDTVKAETPDAHDILQNDPLLRLIVETFHESQLSAGTQPRDYPDPDEEEA